LLKSFLIVEIRTNGSNAPLNSVGTLLYYFWSSCIFYISRVYFKKINALT